MCPSLPVTTGINKWLKVMINIKTQGATTNHIEITDQDGKQITDVRGLRLSLSRNSLVIAEVDLCVGKLDMQAHPLLSIETLKASAEYHGLVLHDDLSKLSRG